MKETDEIIRELTEEELFERKPFSHFGWEGAGAFSFSAISDGYWLSAKTLLEKMKNESNNFAIVDTLVYPLFFNYRHSIETFLKLLFFNYGEQTEQARRDFLELGHDLQHLWAKLRPLMNEGKKHVGSSLDLNVIEYYIKSINDFDPDSMVMRYPIEKNLVTNKKHEHHFDFINFGERMDELCNSLRKLDYDLSNQLTEVASLEELNKYLDIIEKFRQEIDSFISLLNIEVANDTKEDIDFFDKALIDLKNREPSKIAQFLKECDSDLLILLDNLYYGGRSVNDHSVRLSYSPVMRQKEFVKFCNEQLERDRLCFGQVPNDQINIFGKMPSSLLTSISTALSILDLEPID